MVRLLPNLLPTPKPLYGHEMKKPLQINDLQGFSLFGGVDGTRTRDPRRDRPVF